MGFNMSSEESDKHYVPFVGLLEDYVGRSPWDFYSWGHIALGIASFALFSLAIDLWELFIGPVTIPWYFSLIFVVIVAVGWEIIENTILWRLGVKYGNRKDTFINAFFDILFVLIGALGTWLLKWIIMDAMGERGRWFYFSAICVFLLVLIAYFIGFYITNENTKKSRKEHSHVIS
jgi:hypothetical protein